MIEKRTVFILGAGASCPYGFPTARGLRAKIIGNFVSAYEALLHARQIPGVDVANGGYPSITEAKQFVSHFDESSTESIDLFLSRHPQFERIGKIAIALALLKAEHESQFRERVKNSNEDWYFYLFNRLTRELAGRDAYRQFGNSNVAFITFNYDRSLEYFLFTSLLHAFEGADPLTVEDQILHIPIVHVYGQIAPLKLHDRSGEDSLNYGRDINQFSEINFLNVINSLYVVREERANPGLERVRSEISKAGRILFLGFGYADENLRALGLPDILRPSQYIYGTAKAWVQKEISDLTDKLGHALGRSERGRPSQVHLRNCDCVALLREFL